MTGRLVAADLGLEVSAAAGLEEFDRPSLPLTSKEEHARMNAPIFMDLDAAVLGAESGRRALTRFAGAIDEQLTHTVGQNLVAITHGTVIALFVAAHNGIDGFELWKRLDCPSYVVLDAASFRLREVVSTIA
jgi:broad specificity phosphatase PhoE